MERVQRTCSIDYELRQLPDLPLSEIAFAQAEGRLVISRHGEPLFDEDGILLIEFFCALVRWLGYWRLRSVWEYESMDFAETWILRFEVKGSEVEMSSPWLDGSISNPVRFQKNAFFLAAEEFVERFSHELPGVRALVKSYHGNFGPI